MNEDERIEVQVKKKGVSVASLQKALDEYERQHPEASKRRLHIIRQVYTPEFVAQANDVFKASGLVETLQKFLSVQADFSLSVAQVEAIKCKFLAIQALAQVGGMDTVRRHLAELTVLSQRMLSGVDMDAVRRSLVMSESARKSFEASFTRFSRTYIRFYTALEESRLDLGPLGEQFPELPAEGFFCATDAVHTILTPDQEDAIDDNLNEVRDRIRNEGGEVLKAGLNVVNPQLLPSWEGIQDIIVSNNPEKGRYVCSSLRELLTRILHSVASDDRIRQWSSDPKHYDDKNRPTRRARLEYICRNSDQRPLRAVVEEEVKFALDLLTKLNRMTHHVPSINDEQVLSTLVANTQTAIRVVLAVSAVNGQF